MKGLSATALLDAVHADDLNLLEPWRNLKKSSACMWAALPLAASLCETQRLKEREAEREGGQDMSESQRLGGAAYRANTLWK